MIDRSLEEDNGEDVSVNMNELQFKTESYNDHCEGGSDLDNFTGMEMTINKKYYDQGKVQDHDHDQDLDQDYYQLIKPQ
jgi:hypothetical protein